MQTAPSWPNMMLEMMPVDTLCQLILLMAQQPQSTHQTLHVNNPQGISWNDYIKNFEQYGYPIKLINPTQWQQSLKQLSVDNALFRFTELYEGSKTLIRISNLFNLLNQ